MQQWQYHRDEFGSEDELDEKLRHWGDLGWELVAIIQGLPGTSEGPGERWDRWMLILKQPKGES